MLTKEEKQEEISYQVKLIQKDKLRERKGHLSLTERDKITILYGEGLSIRKIASILDRSASTISRELKRPEAVFYRGKYIGCLTVLVDRATRLTRIRKTASHTSKETVLSIASIKDTICSPIKSITYDNGKEFSKHEIINKILNTVSYFCKPYHSWEKGTVENINGIIRRFFPKGTDFDTISEEAIKRVEDWINNRPMKVLGFKTPYEKYLELVPIS